MKCLIIGSLFTIFCINPVSKLGSIGKPLYIRIWLYIYTYMCINTRISISKLSVTVLLRQLSLLYVHCSSEFALRSYLYIIFHELVGRPASWLFADEKVSFKPSKMLIFWCFFNFYFEQSLYLLTGESFLCGETLSWSSICCFRCHFSCSSFQKVWKTSCFLCTCNALLS